MARFDKAIATATRLIKKNGQLVDWMIVKDGANSVEPWKPTEVDDTKKKVYICFVPIDNKVDRKFVSDLTGTEVPIGKLAGLMGTQNFTPSKKDVVVRDGIELTICNIDLLSPNGQKVLYTIEFEG